MTVSGPVLLSLVSRQAWPHILTVARFRPSRLVLLHSKNETESRQPAERLKKFFDGAPSLVGSGGVELAEVPDNDFWGIQKRLDELAPSDAPEGAKRLLNLTAGNKLMAFGASRWAEKNGVAYFYLERGDQLTLFEPSGRGLSTKTETLDGGIANDLDVLALLRCQLSASEVERPGQRLTLTQRGRGLKEDEFLACVERGDDAVRGLLNVEGTADRRKAEGDALEFVTAAVALKHGATEVRRSLRLRVNSPLSPNPHQEIDLLFNWGGRLWLVDCKDRVSGSRLVRNLRDALPAPIAQRVDRLLSRLDDEMKVNPVKALKEDLVANLEVGGLRGKVVCVRRVPLPPEAHPYAKLNGIDVVQMQHLFASFRRMMHPGGPATQGDLEELQRRFAR